MKREISTGEAEVYEQRSRSEVSTDILVKPSLRRLRFGWDRPRVTLPKRLEVPTLAFPIAGCRGTYSMSR